MKLGVLGRELQGSGGTRSYLHNVLPHLSEEWDDELVLFSSGDQPAQLGCGATHVDTKTDTPVVSDHLIVPYLLRRKEIDISWFPKNVIPVGYDGPAVVTIHDLGYFVDAAYYPLLDRLYMKRMVRNACRRADRIIAVSHHTKQDIVAHTNAAPEDVTVIYHGVSDRFRTNPPTADLERFSDRYDLSGCTIYGGNVGRRKNIATLISSLTGSSILQKNDVDLVFTGANPSPRQAEAIDAREWVRYLGYIDDTALPLLYRNATAFVYPSLYEGFGLPLLEAMASGTPVVASNATSIPEVVGDAALLVDPNDAEEMRKAIESVVTDEEINRWLINRGRNRSRKFTWEKTAQQLVATFLGVDGS